MEADSPTADVQLVQDVRLAQVETARRAVEVANQEAWSPAHPSLSSRFLVVALASAAPEEQIQLAKEQHD